MKIKFCFVSVLALFASFVSAHASPVTITDAQYGTFDVTYVYQIPSNIITTLEANPWWGNSAEALAIATDVGTQLGAPFYGVYGPAFVYSTDGSNVYGYFAGYGGGIIAFTDGYSTGSSVYYYATGIQTATVPDGGSTFFCLGGGLLLVAALRRRLCLV